MTYAPVILNVAAAILVVVAFLVRGRPKMSSLLAAAGAALLALFALLAPTDEVISVLGVPLKLASTWSVLGRSLELADSNRAAVSFLYLSGGFMIGGSWVAFSGKYLPSLGLVALTLLANSLLVRPFLFAAIFIELAAMSGVFILVTAEFPRNRGALRMLALTTMAMFVILLAGWMLERIGVTSDTLGLTRQVWMLLGFGVAILIGVPPFHLWLPTASEEADPYAVAFVAVIMQSAGLFLLLRTLDAFGWIRENTDLVLATGAAGMVMVWFGGISAVAQKRLRKVLAYLLTMDFGVALIAVGAGDALGYQLALGLTATRVVGLAVLSGGLVLLGLAGEKKPGARLGGADRALGVAALLMGLLSVGGLPLTAGFPGRWALLKLVGPMGVWLPMTVVAAWVFVGAAVVKGLGSILEGGKGGELRMSRSEKVFVALGVVLCLALGLFPQATYPWLVRAAAGLTNLVP